MGFGLVGVCLPAQTKHDGKIMRRTCDGLDTRRYVVE